MKNLDLKIAQSVPLKQTIEFIEPLNLSNIQEAESNVTSCMSTP
jgi:hypothetical protein